MEFITVSNKCMGCGTCFQLNDYIVESDDGNAVATGVPVKDDNRKQVQQIITSCPVKALSLEERNMVKQSGDAGVQELIQQLEAYAENFTVPRLKSRHFPVPTENIEYYVQKAILDCVIKPKWFAKKKSKALEEAKEAFWKYCYSEKAWQSIVRKVLTNYTVENFTPYYTTDDNKNSAYFPYNQSIRQHLNETYETLKMLQPDHVIDESWKQFFCVPQEWQTGRLTEYNRWKNTSVMDAVEEGLASKNYYLSELTVNGTSYEDHIWDFIIEPEGFYSADFGEGLNDFARDLTEAIESLFTYHLEPEEAVNETLEGFESKARETLQAKVEELKSFYKPNVKTQQAETVIEDQQLLTESVAEKQAHLEASKFLRYLDD